MPRVQMTPMVKFSLYLLPLYLIGMLVMIVIKFYKVIHG